MGLYKHNGDGNLQIISGRGKAEYGASTVREGFFEPGTVAAHGTKYYDVVFSEPMPDDDYEVIFEMNNSANDCVSAIVTHNNSKKTTGFRARVVNAADTADSTIKLYYKAFKLYTDNEYNNILASMPSSASSSNKLLATNDVVNNVISGNTKPVTSGAVYAEIYNNGFKQMEIPVSARTASTGELTLTDFRDWVKAQNFPNNTKLFLHCSAGSETTLIGTYTRNGITPEGYGVWAFIKFSYQGSTQLWRCQDGGAEALTFTLT